MERQPPQCEAHLVSVAGLLCALEVTNRTRLARPSKQAGEGQPGNLI